MKYALCGAVLALITPTFAAEADCYKLSTTIKEAVTASPEKVLEVVASQVAQNESCACEIVKAAIVASGADKKLVANIVSAAITQAPDQIRIIGQCAIAVAPDALAQVQAIVTQFAANGGDGYGAKDGFAKDGFAGDGSGPGDGAPGQGVANPLNFPSGAIDGPGQSLPGRGPTVGGPGGFPLFTPGTQPPVTVLTPPALTPPSATNQ